MIILVKESVDGHIQMEQYCDRETHDATTIQAVVRGLAFQPKGSGLNDILTFEGRVPHMECTSKTAQARHAHMIDNSYGTRIIAKVFRDNAGVPQRVILRTGWMRKAGRDYFNVPDPHIKHREKHGRNGGDGK